MQFADRLARAVMAKRNAVCVGIDPRPDALPPKLLENRTSTLDNLASAFEVYAKGVIDAVWPLVPIVKFQAAFFEALGPSGFQALHEAAEYASAHGLLVIFDGKRNDIGSTAEAYAEAYLSHPQFGGSQPQRSVWSVDAITINPWLGEDGVIPFLKAAERERKGLFILARTSNPSAGQFQDRIADGKPLYRHVADAIVGWNASLMGELGYGGAGAVVGATSPQQLAELRQAMPGVWFLVPGYGAQGGSARDVAAAFDDKGLGAIINSSRGVGFAYRHPTLRELYGDYWQGAVAHAAREMIADLARHTPCGKL